MTLSPLPIDKAQLIHDRLPRLAAIMASCTCCGRLCHVDRWSARLGFCRTPLDGTPPRVRYAAATLHFGEEPMLVGNGGSGTVFFSRCNLRCVFCQNYQISWEDVGKDVSPETLADVMLELQQRGAENINLVTATQCIYPVMLALEEAFCKGLSLPIVYNTNGYETVELLRCLEGIIDIYLPDMKYMLSDAAARYSGAANYPDIAKEALREMWRQVGPYRCEEGRNPQGVILRHLVLPDNLAGSYDLLLWLRDENFLELPLSLMCQYSPQYRASDYPELARTLTEREYRDIVQYAIDLGFENLLVQEFESQHVYLPDFERPEPFAP